MFAGGRPAESFASEKKSDLYDRYLTIQRFTWLDSLKLKMAFQWVRIMTRRIEGSEALVNTAFFNLWQAAKRGNIGYLITRRQLLGLLRKSIRNLIIDIVRERATLKRGPNHKRTNFEVVMELTPDHQPIETGSGSFSELIDSVQVKLNELSDRRLGDIFVIRMQGWPFTKIARYLGIGETTVRDRLKVA